MCHCTVEALRLTICGFWRRLYCVFTHSWMYNSVPLLFIFLGLCWRNLELVLFGVQQVCVVVDLGEEMPSTGDIQLAHTRLRALCLGGTYHMLWNSVLIIGLLVAYMYVHGYIFGCNRFREFRCTTPKGVLSKFYEVVQWISEYENW